jgi:hypothetical protein
MSTVRPKHVLLVAHQPDPQDELRAWLHAPERWTLARAANPSEAMRSMELEAADTVVLDLAVPGGLELLKELRDRWPLAARLVLGGTRDLKFVMDILALAHQFLAQPVDPLLLRSTVSQSIALLDLMDDPALGGDIRSLDLLPTLPKVYWHLLEALNNPNLSMQDIARLVEADPQLSEKALQMVNSSYFGLENPIHSVRQAVGYLGPEVVAGMGLSASILRALKGEMKELRPLALSAQPRTPSNPAPPPIPDPQWAEQAFTTSLVHDIGLILFSIRVPAPANPAGPPAPDSLMGIWACPEE